MGLRFPSGLWDPGLQVKLEKSLQAVILFRCRRELPQLPAALPLSLCQAGASLIFDVFPVAADEPIQAALVLRHLLSQPCLSPLCYPPGLSWSLLLPCLSLSFLASILSSGHWPHLKIPLFLLSWHYTETLSFWKLPFLHDTEFFRGVLGTMDKSDIRGVLPSSSHTALYWCKCHKKGFHFLGAPTNAFFFKRLQTKIFYKLFYIETLKKKYYENFFCLGPLR